MSPINGKSYPQYWELLLWQLLEIIVTPIRTCCMGIYQLFVPTLDNISLKRVILPFDKSLTHCLPLHWRIFWSTWWYLKFCIGFFSSWSLRISDYEFDVVESGFMRWDFEDTTAICHWRNSPNSSWYLNLNIGQYDNLVNQDFTLAHQFVEFSEFGSMRWDFELNSFVL